jgi:hypothetical protein
MDLEFREFRKEFVVISANSFPRELRVDSDIAMTDKWSRLAPFCI